MSHCPLGSDLPTGRKDPCSQSQQKDWRALSHLFGQKPFNWVGKICLLLALYSHLAHKPKTPFEKSLPKLYVFPYEGSSPTFGHIHSSSMGDQRAVCSDARKAHSFPCGTLSTGTPASPDTESSQGSGHPLGQEDS